MMQLRKLNVGAWTVAALVDADGVCAVEDALLQLSQDRKGNVVASGFVAQWERISHEGPWRLGSDIYHQVDKKNEIYEFIKGSHRLLCFQADGRVVICSHIFRKQSRKTPAAEKKKAASLRQRYLAAMATDDVVFED